MKTLILTALCFFAGLVFAAEPTPLQLARVLQIKSVQQSLNQIRGTTGQIAVSYEEIGGMESHGYDISINLTERADQDGHKLKNCAIEIQILGPKYTDKGQLGDVSFALTKADLRSLSVFSDSCHTH